MDPSRGYNRRLRKLLHIAGGIPAFFIAHFPYWLILSLGLAVLALSYVIKPKAAWWLRVLSKPRDRIRGEITGLRGYCMVVTLLIVLWPLASWLTGVESVRFVMFGWAALALGDGLAGLVGPGPAVAATVFWNKSKTWWGFAGCIAGTYLAFCLSMLVPVPQLAAYPWPQIVVLALPISIIVALLESLDIPIDDNYLVGIGAPLLAAGVVLVVFQ